MATHKPHTRLHARCTHAPTLVPTHTSVHMPVHTSAYASTRAHTHMCMDMSLQDKIAYIREHLPSNTAETDANKVLRQYIEDLPDDEAAVVVEASHFTEARRQLQPSVSEEELQYYRSVQAQFAQQQ